MQPIIHRISVLLMALMLTFTTAGCTGAGPTATSPDAGAVVASTTTPTPTAAEAGTSGDASPTSSATTSDVSATSNTSAATPEATPEANSEPRLIDLVADGTMTIDDLLAEMTLEEKIGQMLQAERVSASPSLVTKYALGSILSGGGSVPGDGGQEAWLSMMQKYQDAAAQTRLGIPVLYGVDAVHGHNNAAGAVIFPHNIGLGAANDPAMMAQIGDATAREVTATGVRWNFAPVVAPVGDIRWGRTYEGFSQDPARVAALSIPYITGHEAFGVVACAKHFIADGATIWGTGDHGYHIDQGDARMSEETLRSVYLPLYKQAVDAGVKTVMVSFSSWNGVKHHGNQYLITDVLKGELGFEGFVVTDWEALHQVEADGLHDQVVKVINAGVDMLMEPDHWPACLTEIRTAVDAGEIPQARIDDAVRRILRVKLSIGLLKHPLGPASGTQATLGDDSVRALAREAAAKSLVLLKNDQGMLPLAKDAKLLVLGPAADDLGVQCGGWTREWQGGRDRANMPWVQGTTILEGLRAVAESSGGRIVTDPAEADGAAAVLVVLGERPYAEGQGDDGTLTLYEGTALPENRAALEAAEATGLPVITVLVSGRPRLVTEELNNWSAFVAAWLPGSEGAGVADVLYGDKPFTGTLPYTWPKTLAQADTKVSATDVGEPLFPLGYAFSK